MRKTRNIVVFLAVFALLALAVPAFAQTPIPPPTFDETLTGITSLAASFNVALVIFIGVVIGGAAYLYRRMTKAAR